MYIYTIEYLQMLVVLNIAEKKLFDFRVKSSESLVLFRIREVDIRISSGRDNVELGIEHVDSMDDTV